MKKKINKFIHSSIGYLPFKIIEGTAGFAAIAIYSRLLTTQEFGHYALINPSVMLIYLVFFGWTYFATSRFIGESQKDSKKGDFYSTLFGTQLLILLGIGILYGVYALYQIVFNKIELFPLIVYGIFFLGYGMNQLYVNLLLYIHKRWENILLLVLVAVGKPLFVVGLYLVGTDKMYIILIAHGILDFLVGMIALKMIKPCLNFSWGKYQWSSLKKYFSYGYPMIGLMLTMYILNVSDRFMIKGFYSTRELGIYAPNYAIASALFVLLTYGLSRGYYPRVLKVWKDRNHKKTELYMKQALTNYIVLITPAVVGVYIVSNTLAKVVLDTAYIEGYPVIGLVAIGMGFLGLADYYNKTWELASNTGQIFINSFIAAIVNLVLNFIFIPKYGYIAAAYTTMISFVFYAILSYVRREHTFHFSPNISFLLKVLVANVVMAFCVIMTSRLDLNLLPLMLLQACIGVLTYGSIIWTLKVYKFGGNTYE